MKNINKNINTQNNIYDNNSKYIYKKNENDNRNNWGKIPYEKKTIIENINDNTNDIYWSLTTIRVDNNNNSFITSFNEENNVE